MYMYISTRSVTRAAFLFRCKEGGMNPPLSKWLGPFAEVFGIHHSQLKWAVGKGYATGTFYHLKQQRDSSLGTSCHFHIVNFDIKNLYARLRTLRLHLPLALILHTLSRASSIRQWDLTLVMAKCLLMLSRDRSKEERTFSTGLLLPHPIPSPLLLFLSGPIFSLAFHSSQLQIYLKTPLWLP